MSDLANLYIKVDSSEVVTSSRDLDKLTGTVRTTEKATVSAATGFSKLQASCVAASVAIVAVAMAMQRAMVYMELGAKTSQIESSFKIMTNAANVAGDAMVANMKRATRETIDDSALMAKAIKLMVMGYDSTQVERFSKNVITASQIMGVKVSEAYELLSDAIATKMTRSLLRMGAVTRDQLSLVNTAVSQGIDEFALYNLAMANLELQTLKLKGTQDQGTIALQKFHAEVEETKEFIGKQLNVAIKGLYGELQMVASAALYAVGGLAALLNLRSKIRAATEFDKQKKAEDLQNVADYLKMKNDLFGAASGLMKKGTLNLTGDVKSEETATAAQIEAAKKRVEAEKANIQAQIDAIKATEKAKRDAEEAAKKAAEIQKLKVDLWLKDEARKWEELAEYEDEYKKTHEKWNEDLFQSDLDRFSDAEDAAAKYLEQMKKDAEKVAADQIIFADKLLQDKLTLYKDLAGFEDEYRQAQLEWIYRIRDEEAKNPALREAAYKKAAISIIKVDQAIYDAKSQQIQQGLSDISSMFQSLAGMYDQSSSQYAHFQDLANAIIVAEKAIAVVRAVNAVTAAASLPPPAGFAAMASMAAAMGTLLGSIGVAFSGGAGANTGAIGPAYGQNTTVLGGANNQASESITKGWKLLEDTYEMEETKLSGIWNEMKDLNRNITGLATAVIRRIEIGGTGGMELGLQQPAYAKFLQGTGADIEALSLGVQAAIGYASFGAMAISPAGWVFLGAYAVDKLFGTDIIGKASRWLFGSSTTSVTGGGLQIANQGQIVRGYTTTQTESRGMFGGLFGGNSSSTSTAYSAIDQMLVNLISGPKGVYTGIKKSLQWFAENLGADTSKAISYAFADVMIDLRGLTGDEIQKKLSEEFSRIADVATEALFGSMIAQYQEINEGLFETASRLVVSKEIILSTLEMTGKSFSGAAIKAIELSQALIEMAGGLDKLIEAASTYYDKFFTDEEKHIRLQGILTDTLASMYLILPATREGYRDLVEALDLTTESGQRAYIALLKASEYADQYYSALEDMAEKAAQTIQDAMDSVSSAVDAQISMARSAASEARAMADTYRGIIENLSAAQRKIRGTEGSQGRVGGIFALAMTGNQAALQSLPDAIDEMLAVSLKTSATAEDYARDQGKALIQLEQAKTISQGMVNWEEYQATLLETQVGVLEAIKAQLELPTPDLDILNQQAGLLQTITGLLQEQTMQIVTGNNQNVLLMQDQTGKVILANTLTADQTGQIVNGNLILTDSKGLILSSNTLLTDQTGKIVLGNTLTGTQTSQIITGNATRDAIKNISNLNTSYSEEMLAALVTAGSNQTTSLQNIATQTALTVAAIQQLIQLTAANLAAQEVAAAKAEADRLAAEEKAAADKAAADLAALVASTTAAFNVQATIAEEYRAQWDAFATARASSAFLETQESYATGTPYSVGGYYSYSDAERTWLTNTYNAYMAAFQSAYELWKAIPGHAFGLDYVPKDDYLMRAHQGEAILTPPQAADWRSGRTGGDNVIMIDEIRALRAEIKAGNYQLAKNTNKMMRVMNNIDQEMNTDGILTRTA